MEPNLRIAEESPSLEVGDISSNVTIREKSPEVRMDISARETTGMLWQYDDNSVQYDDPNYTYDGIVEVSFFKPSVGIGGSIPSMRIV